MNLADKIIEANEQEYIEKQRGDQAPNGYYTDDLGQWVEQDIRKNKARFAEYIFVRCRKLNPHLHLRDETYLYNSHTLITKSPNDIAELANIPETIAHPTAIWVYNKLVDTVPRLDKSMIEVAPGLLWDFEKQALVERDRKTYTTVS